MIKTITTICAAKLNAARAARPMNIILWVLLVNIAISALLFLVLLTRLPWEEIDWWLKAISAEFAAVVFFTGLLALYSGGVVNEQLNERVATLGKETAGLQRETAEARTKQAEAEKALLELEQAVAPRRWPKQWASVQELKRFAGVTVILEYFDKDDCPEIASLITGTLSAAQWRIDGPYPSTDRNLTFDGIEIQHSVGPTASDDVSGLAAIVLAEQLLSRDLDFQLRPSGTQLPPNTIRIKVSLRPVTHILSEEERGLREEAKKRQKEALETRKRVEEQ